MTRSLGKPPELRRIDKRLIQVDPTYQRHLNSRRSEAVVLRIRDNFDWLKFGVLTLTKDHYVVDGQHRHAAAMLRDDVQDVPCIVMPITDRAAAAAIFVSINRDRTALTPLAIFKAELAAGSDDAVRIADLAKSAGVQVLSYPVPWNEIKPNQTMAISTLRDLYRKNPDVLRDALAACVTSGAGLSAIAIKAAARAFSEGALVGTVISQLTTMRGVTVDNSHTAPGGRAEAFFRMMRGEIEKPAPRAPAPAKPKAPPVTKKAKPFTFKRTAPPGAPKPKPIEIRGDVPVRRFEAGVSTRMVDEALASQGLKLKTRGNGTYEITKIEGKGRPKIVHLKSLMAMVDEIRGGQGKQPISKRS